MKRALLFLFALLVSASFSFSFATDADPANPDLLAQGLDNKSGDETFDPETNTITFPDGGGGIGWSFWDNGDLSAYQTITIEWEPVEFSVTVIIEYNDGSDVEPQTPQTKRTVAGSVGRIVLDIQPTTVGQILIQSSEPGELTLIAAYLGEAEEAEDAYEFDFDSDEPGQMYPTIAWFASDITAEVEEDPESEGNALHIMTLNWDAYPKFSVTLPEGKTLADVEKITLDIYFTDNGSDQNNYKNINYFIGERRTSFEPDGITGNAKNIIGASEEIGVWLPKEFPLGQKDGSPIEINANLLELNQFDFGMGIHCEEGNYYMDNISFVLKDEEPGGNDAFDFESDNIGAIYSMMHAWGSPKTSSAAVVADPLEASEKCLKVAASDYDGVVYFPVTLPDGFTVADITGIQFDSYFEDPDEQYAAVELFIAPKNATVGSGVNFNTYPVYLKTSDGTGGKPEPIQVSSPNEWFIISITRDRICDENFNFAAKYDFSEVDDLSEFMFGIGISVIEGTEYYMDNIMFILDDGTGIITVTPTVSKVYGTEGGIAVTANNEKVSVYGIDGRLTKQTVAGYNTFISLSKGIYIVKVGDAKPVKVLVN